MPKTSESARVIDQATIEAARPERTLQQQLDEELGSLQPVPEEEIPAALARLNVFTRYIWDFLCRLNPSFLNPEKEFSVQELSDFLPDHPAQQTIYGWVCDEKIPYVKRGKKLFFPFAKIIAWNNAGRPANPENALEIAQTYVANHKPGDIRR